jgi:transcriptional regulator with PAS, ATPase and Fis domain
MQSQLLRVIQEHQYKRVGGNKWFETDFRLVSATNKNLDQAVNCGDFRSDLYYRIAGWICKLPPLRERTEDILILTKNFLSELRPDHQCPEIDDYLSQYLTRRDYPGNIRELKQLVTRINARYVGAGPVTLGALPEDERPENMDDYTTWRDNQFEQDIRKALTYGAGLKEISQYASETAINIAVSNEEGNLQKAAKVLGVTDRALQMRRANRRS